jgi:hypothetical protein
VLGGRDHRIGAGTRIDEPTAPGVDAWLWAAEFDELLGPLTVGGQYLAISGRRFSWSGTVRIVNDPPTYILSAADWLTLVEKFGLAANVDDTSRKG